MSKDRTERKGLAGMGGRVCVVTGASAGVGRAVARELGARGDAVGLLARGARGLEAAADEVVAAGGRALGLVVDTSDHEALQAAADRVEEEFGPIDLWINVAFTSVFAPFSRIEPEEFRRVTEVSYLGYVYGTKVALRSMLTRGNGTIVQVGSALSYRGIPLQSAYCGAKHAIQGFNESLRCELLHAGSNIHTTMVLLPAVNTPQFRWVLSRLPQEAQPVPPIYQPEVAAQAICFAADHPSRREYWVGGSTVGTLLANAVAPGILDRYLARTGFSSQQTGTPRDPDDPVNLWEPADGPDGRDFGAHGAFDDKATSRSLQVWASQHHSAVIAGMGAVVGAAAMVGRRLVQGRLG